MGFILYVALIIQYGQIGILDAKTKWDSGAITMDYNKVRLMEII
jgi:hypothetical protein